MCHCQFSNGIVKQYLDPVKNKIGEIVLFDVSLNEDINGNNDVFTDYERYILLGT